MTKTPRILIPAAVRNYVFQRDGHRCQSCGKTGKKAKLQVDHIVPLAKGGSNDLSNLQALCAHCNQRKCDRIDLRFQRRFES
jgi:5-methylcytosine-specific restriction protein A